MGYWSKHPMGGDAPCDAAYVIDNMLVKLEGYKSEEELATALNPKGEELEYLWDLPFEIMYELHNKHKYYLMDNIERALEESRDGDDMSFVLPFRFLDYDIRVSSDKVDDLVYLLKDGGAGERGYDYDDEDSPYAVVKDIIKNKDLLFNEEINPSQITEIPEEVREHLCDKGLLTSIFEHVQQGNTGLVNKK